MDRQVDLSREGTGVSQSVLDLADLLVAYLEQLGVEYVFGIPGGAIEPLYNALARSARRGGPRPIVARHETGAAFMADGYARQSGNLAVCCATTGPGATNLITGVCSAYQNHVPMLVVTAQTSLGSFGRGAFQESSCNAVDTVGLFRYCTRYNTLVSHADQFERKLAAAIMHALQSPRGPAHLSVPCELMRSPAGLQGPTYDLAALSDRPSLIDEAAVMQLYLRLKNASQAVFVIGDGSSEAIDTILQLAVLLGAHVLTSPHGKGLVSPYHPLFRGVIGFAGHSTAVDTLTDPGVDVVVAVGMTLGEWSSHAWDPRLLLNRRLIHVDDVEDHLTRSPMASLHVRGRIGTVFERLLGLFAGTRDPTEGPESALGDVSSGPAMPEAEGNEEPARRFHLDEECKYADDSVPIKPQRLMRELARLFPPSTRFLADTGSSLAWAIHYLHPYDRRVAGRRDARGEVFRGCLEFSSMGWAIGAAIGTALGYPGGPVLCITGDGSLLMSGQEITVAVQERCPVIFVVLNDSALGMVKHGQRLGGAEPIAFDLPAVDYCAYARAMGAEGHIIRSPRDLLSLDVDALCRRAGPTLLDVRIDAEEMPPIGLRIQVLHESA